MPVYRGSPGMSGYGNTPTEFGLAKWNTVRPRSLLSSNNSQDEGLRPTDVPIGLASSGAADGSASTGEEHRSLLRAGLERRRPGSIIRDGSLRDDGIMVPWPHLLRAKSGGASASGGARPESTSKAARSEEASQAESPYLLRLRKGPAGADTAGLGNEEVHADGEQSRAPLPSLGQPFTSFSSPTMQWVLKGLLRLCGFIWCWRLALPHLWSAVCEEGLTSTKTASR